jgi:hypothetical protein
MAFLQANLYELTGSGIEGTVTTSGITGQPTVSLTLDGDPVPDASVERTDEGLQVTATTQVVLDGWTTSLRLVLPQVNLGDDANPEQVGGYAVVLTSKTSIGGPGLVQGAIQHYDVRQVEATASIVEF